MDSPPLCHLHFVFVPFLAPGHLLPMVDMAKLFARRKVKVTIVTTPLNSLQFQASINREIQSGSPIQVLHLQFPHADSGIPEACESLDTLPSIDLLTNFHLALRLMQKPLEELFQTLTPLPSCIIADKYFMCVADVAHKFNVPRIIFDGTSCFHLLCNHNLLMDKVHEAVSGEEKFLVPGMPHRIELRRSQLPEIFNTRINQKVRAFFTEAWECSAKSYGIVVNSFEELEAEYVKEYRRVTGHKVWCVGPVSLSNKDDSDKAQRSARDTNDESKYYLKWLDSWAPRSVIYVCLGSLYRAPIEQMIELGVGLEETKRPFIWVQGDEHGREGMEKWLLEYGFEERVKGRGLLIKGWAPQVLILSHKAIGTFLTHCGWNSTLEGICAGVPLVTFPLFSEQFYNEKVVVQLVETGVSLGVESPFLLGEKYKVNRNTVKDCIEKVMGEGEESEDRRIRAKMIGDMAKKAVGEAGSSYRNISLLIQDILHVQAPIPS